MSKTLQQLIDEREESGWQPIETAPKDETEILGVSAVMKYVKIIRWSHKAKQWVGVDDWKIFWTEYWKPLGTPDKPSHDKQIIDGLLEIVRQKDEGLKRAGEDFKKIRNEPISEDHVQRTLCISADAEDSFRRVEEVLKITTNMEIGGE